VIGENRLDLAILELFLRNTYLSLSINQIAIRLGKTYPNINKKVNELLEEGILNKIVIGRSHLCSLNLENPKTRLLLGILELKNLEENRPGLVKETRELLKPFRKAGQVLFVSLQDKTIFLCVSDKRPFTGMRLPKPWQLTISSPSEMEHLLESSIFSEHHLLDGFERYFEFINDHASHLRRYHDPLLQHHG